MNFKAIFFVLTIILFLEGNSYAQDEILVGGHAICSVHGKSPIKKFKADGNRLLILQTGDISKGSIQLQLIKDIKGALIDINILATLGDIEDVESFLGGSLINVESAGSTFDIKKTIIKNPKN